MADDDKGLTPTPATPPAEPVKAEPTDPQDEMSAEELRAALKETRDEAAKRRIAVKEAQSELQRVKAQLDKYETDRAAAEKKQLEEEGNYKQLAEHAQQQLADLQRQLKETQAQALRARVSAEFGLNIPIDDESGELLGDRLRGDTADELRADAQRLAKLFYARVEKQEPAPSTPATTPEKTRAGSPPVTGVPGGPPSGRTDADRRREYRTNTTDSPIFQRGEVILPPDID